MTTSTLTPVEPPGAAHGSRHGWVRWALPLLALLAVVVGLVIWAPWSPRGPAAPGGLVAEDVTTTSVMLSWTPPTGEPSAEQYVVQRDGTDVASVPASTTTFTDQRLSPNTRYGYSVVALNGENRSAASPVVAVRTLPAAPTGLEATAVAAEELTLAWSGAAAGPNPGSYVVLRNGVEVGEVVGDQTTYRDTGLVPATAYAYTVVAVTGDNASAPSAMLNTRTDPAPPASLKLGKVTASTVVLQWTPPAKGSAPDAYLVLRDSRQVAKLPGTVRSWTDTKLAPVTTHEYAVQAVSAGQASALSPTVTAKTATPAVGDARFKGSFEVKVNIVKSTGLSIGESEAAGQSEWDDWTFTPKCTTGPCAVTVAGTLANHPFTMTLNRSGAVYTGSTKTHITHCGDIIRQVDVKNTLKLVLTVKGAEMSDGVWLVSSWGGTLNLNSPYTSAGTVGLMTYYCPAGSLTAGVNATP